ncbi:MAG: methionine--tRNA ligase [Sphingomonas sp.]|jgi:methionyl-tRNA synthetase
MPGTPYYITTAISYPNGKPHIGHAYEAIAADAIARFQRMQGREVRFQTGTDEHGLKMVQTARDRGVEVADLAREMSDQFQAMCDALNISYDRFQRTTDPAHHSASVAIWEAMKANGDLYLDRYEGWYSVRDEAFYEEKELTDGDGGIRLSPQGTPVEWTVEESWFFKLSKYEKPLLDLYAERPDFIRPDSRRNEVTRFVEGGLRDLSISRTSFDWGVKVPGSPDHVMYVWVDALTNYLTGLGYPAQTAEMAKFWPANLHLIGKDIVRFHAVYWPAFLMSADLPLPKQVFGHGFLLARDGAKMSKSAGNVVDPMALAERYGVDAFRYFMLREVSFGSDGTWSEEAIVARCNAELANSFGNLAQRTLSLIVKNCDGYLPAIRDHTPEDGALFDTVGKAVGETIPNHYDDLALSQAAETWLQAVFACNAYIDVQAPWALKKTDPERMETVLATLFICIAQLAVVIAPLIPASAAKLLDQMGVPEDVRTFAGIGAHWYSPLAEGNFRMTAPQGLFPRLELPAEDPA